MADLMRWPGRDMTRFPSDVDAFLSNFLGFGTPEGLTHAAWPKADIYEDQEGLRLNFEVPGLDPNEVKVQLNENILTVSGERKLENEDRKSNYRRIERSYGAFERSFSLPQNVDTEKVQASYKNGMLSIFIPRSERAKPRSVQVKVDTK
jgi:HSP20 family protein